MSILRRLFGGRNGMSVKETERVKETEHRKETEEQRRQLDRAARIIEIYEQVVDRR